MPLAITAYLAQFAVTVAAGVIFGYLADLQERYGLSDGELGIIASTGFAAALLTQLALAPFIDRGRTGLAAWVAVTAAAAGSFGFVFAEQTWTLAASRGLSGIGYGLFAIAARKALIGTDAAGGGAKVGALLSCAVAGFVSGPAVGAALGTVAFELPFVIIGIAVVIVGLPAAVLISRAPTAASRVDYSHLGELVRHPLIQGALGGQIVFWGFVGLFEATVDRYLTDIGMSNAQIAIGLIALGIPLIVLPPKAGALAERQGARTVFIPAFVALVPAIWIYGFVAGLATFIVIGVVEAIIEAYASMSVQVLALEVTGAEKLALGAVLLEAVGVSAALVAALVGPSAYGALGKYWLFGLWAAGSALVVLVAMQRLRSHALAKGGI